MRNMLMRLMVGFLLVGTVVLAQPQGGPPSQPPGHARIGEVLSDRTIDWRDPQQRAQAVERIREIEIANKERARVKANAMGIPMRRVLPDGTEQEIIGLDEDGEFLIYSTKNADAAISSAANLLHPAPYSLDGSGVTVGVWDGGAVRSTHTEFQTGSGSRVTIMDGAGLSNHGTHVGGTVGARGASATRKGMAPNVLIDSYDWNSDTSEMTGRAASAPGQTTKIYISNHSYGYITGWNRNSDNLWQWYGSGNDQNGVAVQFGQYTSQARDWDNVAYNAPYYLIFKSAGNDNTDNPANGNTVIIGGNSVTYNSSIHPPGDGVYRNGYENISHAGNAKNIITIGAANDAVTSGQRDPSKSTITTFSSRGPTDDGRIKPDIVANGASVSSTSSGGDTSYTTMSGTSMSSPSAAGSAALLVQLYSDLFDGGAMRASTLKGLIIHTATDLGAYGIGNVGPDYRYGWGLMDTKTAADLIMDHAANPADQRMTEDVLNTATPSRIYTFNWDGVSPIRATLCWTDPAGTAITTHDSRAPRLVNDLDLKIIAPDGTEYLPWVMPFVGTWTVESMSLPATTGTNITDNVEQVLIQNPGQSGTWQVVITHKGTLTNDQQIYSLLLSGLTSMPVSMEVTRGGSGIVKGSVDGISGTLLDNGSQITYTISNVGGGVLELTTPVTISGQNNCTVTVNTQPASAVTGGDSTSLVLTVTPSVAGTWSFGISVGNNDAENNPYVWTVTGVARTSVSETFTAAADTYINDQSTGSNYGTETTFRLNNRTSNPNRSVLRGLLRFDLSSIPVDASVISAKLDFVQDNANPGSVDIFEATGSWEELTATWANANGFYGATAFGSANTGSTAGQAVPTITLNASGLSKVQSWVEAPTGNHGFGITTTYNGNNNFLALRSRESATESHRPRLTLEYSISSAAPLMVVTRDSQFLSAGGTDAISDTEAFIGKQLTYVIGNLGDANLTLTTPISVTGQSNCAVSVSTQPTSPVAPSGSTDLVLTVTPAAAGAWSATVSIANNTDADPYTWTISGTALGRFSVSYHANNAESGTVPEDANSPYLEGETVTVLGNSGNLVRSGYVFNGWNTQADGLGTSYASGATFTMPAANRTLYARWNAAPVVEAGPNQTVYLTGSEPWTPAKLTTAAWYDAADESTITKDGSNRVGQWQDKSGNNRHVTQTSDAAKPLSGTRTMNGLNALAFSGTATQWLRSTANIASQPITAIAVAQFDSAGNDSTVFDGAGSARCMLRRRSGNVIALFAGSWVDGAATSAEAVMASVEFNGASSRIRKNGGTAATGNPGAGNLASGITIGNINSPNSSWRMDGLISELVFVSGVLSDDDRQRIEGYLAHKWGLAANLPAEHPYKNAPPGSPTAVATLTGYASDPDGDTLTTQWTKAGGPSAAVTFANASVTNTTATFIAEGNYTLRLTANDGFQQAQDDVVITVAAPGSGTYTVALDKQEGSGGSDSVEATFGLPMPAATAPTRVGYTFGGYFTAINGGGTQYYTAAMESARDWDVVGNATLYAQWFIPATYTWTGGGADGGWGASGNWDSAPVFNAENGVIFNTAGAGNLATFLGADRTIGAITFNASATNVVTLRTTTAAANTTAANLTLGSASVPGTITVQSVNAVHRIGDAAGNIVLANNLTINHGSSSAWASRLDFGRGISGTGGIIKEGQGIVVFSGVNTFTGDTLINAGTLQASTAANFSTNSTYMLNGSSARLRINNSSGDQTFGNALQIGANGGTLSKGNAGTLNFMGTFASLGTGDRTLTLHSDNATAGTGAATMTSQLSDSATGALSINKTGANTWILAGANTFSGSTTVSQGLLILTDVNALQFSHIDTTGTVAGNATEGLRLAYGSNTELTIGGLTGNKDLATIFTIDTGGYGSVTNIALNTVAGKDLTYAGVIDGARSLTKTGSGSQTLSGAQNYTGATVVDAGTLRVNGSLAAGSAVTVNNGGTLAGAGTVGGSLTIAAGGVFLADGAALAVGGAVTLDAGATLDLSGIAPVGDDPVVLMSYGSRSGTFNSVTVPDGWVLDYSYAGNQIALVPDGPITPPSYTVTYNGNGSDGGSVPVDENAYLSGAMVTVLGTGTLSRTEWTFADWNTSPDGTGTRYAPGDTFAITANTTLYARWVGVMVDPDTPVDALPQYPGHQAWRLVFSDEFNGTSVDTNKWNIDDSLTSRAARTDRGINKWFWKPENVRLENGNLVLDVVKHDFETMYCGSVNTRDIFEPEYGFFEARVQIGDTTKDTHTAFWLQGHAMRTPPVITGDAHNGAEVDIFESAWFGDYTKAVVHIDGYGSDHRANTKQYSTPGLHDGFNVFGLKWTASYMKIYYNGEHKVTYDGIWVPRTNEWVWLSNGASFGDIGTFSAEELGWLTAAKFDYVRVWESTTNLPPVFTADPMERPLALVDEAYSNTIAGSAMDPELDPLTYSKVSGPTWLSVAADGALSGTPTNDDRGTNTWVVQVVDDQGGMDQATLRIVVQSPNDPRVLVGGALLNGDFNANPGESVTFANTEVWYNTRGAQTQVATRSDEAYDGTQNATVHTGRGFGVDTGYVIVEGNTFDFSYVWKDSFNWVGASGEVKVSLFVTDDDTITGVRTDLVADYSGIRQVAGAYEAVSREHVYTATASDAGKILFAAIETDSEGFARLDNFVLIVKPIVYTVTYDDNGSTGGSVPVDSSSPYISGATVTVLGNAGSLVKTGYSFAGWNTAADGSGSAYAPSGTFTITADTTLYAQWALVQSASARHYIRGKAQNEGTHPLGYYTSSSVTIGTGGASGSITDQNVVFGFTLPTLPADTTLESATFNFEITAARDSTGGQNLPELHVYLLNSSDPTGSGTAFFYHGAADPSANVKQVGATSVSITGTAQIDYAAGAEVRSLPLGGDALTLLKSFYDGNTPKQSAVYFRFNMSVDPAITTYRRYNVSTLADGSSLELLAGVPKLPATVTLGNLNQTYDGTPRLVTAMTEPDGLTVSITYNGSETAPINAGSYSVVATVVSDTYEGSTNGTLTVAQLPVTVNTWPTAASIYEGQPVGDATLSGGSASVDGNFDYLNPMQMLSVGTHSVSVVFTPADAVNYESVTGTVTVVVEEDLTGTWRSELYPRSWTPPGPEKLFYTDKLIQDFSYAGYKRGEAAVPQVTGPIFDVTAAPYNADKTGSTDATASIQAAINAAGTAGGGVVYLPAGTYLVEPSGANSYSLQINKSDIVLRGAGVGQTFILNTSYQMRSKSVIRVAPSSTSTGSAVLFTADLEGPTRRIPVADAGAFAVGDIVRMEWVFTQAWIDEHNQGTWWSAGAAPADARYYREVMAVNASEGWIEVDIPTRYTMKMRDSASVRKITGMLTGVGIEDLSIGNVQHTGTGFGENDYLVEGTVGYEVHGSWLVSIRDTYDSWVSGVESYQPAGNTSTCHLLSNGLSFINSFRNTVRNAAMRRAQYGGGGGNGYMFRFQQANDNLITDSIADFSRHGFVISHAGTSGNVFRQCEDRNTARATGSSGSYTTSGSGSDHHMHFSHSNLFDGSRAHDSFFTAHHRVHYGTIGHALTSAHGVYWNMSGSGTRYSTIVVSEQGRYGYVIGTSGTRSGASNPTNGNTAPADHLEGLGTGDTLSPQSLYLDQLSKRLTGVLVSAGTDFTTSTNAAVPVSGSVYTYGSGPVNQHWSQVSGPSATFSDASALSTTVSLMTDGAYVLKLTAWDGGKTNSATITITVDSTVPVVDAGPDQTVYLGESQAWTPASISTVAWYDASDNNSLTLVGGKVSQWNDKSTNNRHALQGTDANRPTYQASDAMINNLPSIGASGLSGSIGLDAPSMSARNAYVVAYYANGQTTTFSGYPTLFSGPGSFGEFRVMGNQNTTGFIGTYNFNNAGTFKNGSTTSSLTGVLPMPASVFTFKSGASRTQVYSLGYNKVTADRTWHGGYSEIIFTDGTEDLETQQKIEGYLAHKWGVTLADGHPYKSAPPGGATATATLAGYASDPGGDPLTTQWTKVGGPIAAVTFADASVTNTTATFIAEGIYTLRLTADDGLHQAYDDVVITVVAAGSTYSVVYHPNGATDGNVPVDANSPYEPGALVTVLGNTGDLVRTGHTFAGWNTQADGNGTSYAPDATFTINADTTLYAQWAGNAYTVTFDANEGTAPDPATKSVTYGATYGELPTTSREGYVFTGWFTAASGGVLIESTTEVTMASDHTLHAQWSDTYTVTLDRQGGSGGSSSVEVTLGSAMPAAAAPTRTGYTFGGYYTAINGGGKQYYTAAMASARNWDIAQNTTLYAKWTGLPIVISPEIRHQEMVGFGAALSWYTTWIYNGSAANSEALESLMFEDLGLDVLRLKNWYFPNDSDSTSAMNAHNRNKTLFDAAKAANPDIQVLYSSWSPPDALKSNGERRNGGTLKKDGEGKFMYGALADYWVEVLDNLGWTPDYLSFQNEPGWVATWETCEFSTYETATKAGYAEAADAIWNAIKDRPVVPKMVGSEAENMPAFFDLNQAVKARSYFDVHGYHVYDINSTSAIDSSTTISRLRRIRDEFGDRPNWQTEFSNGFGWIDAARVIHNTLVEANASAYIYWKLAWAASNDTMIEIAQNGDFSIKPHYYTVKHYSRHIHKGYERIDVGGSTSDVRVSGFLSPEGNSITIVAINRSTSQQPISLLHADLRIEAIAGYQSVEGNFYQTMSGLDVAAPILLPASSITTIVLTLADEPAMAVYEDATLIPVDAERVFMAPLDTPVSHTYVVTNMSGARANLLLTNTPDAVVFAENDGMSYNGFTISPNITGDGTELAPGESASFTVSFQAAEAGSYAATVHIANNDPWKNPYTFTVSATVASYTVTYNGNQNTGGTEPAPQPKQHGVDLTLAANSGNLTRTGYTFVGWNTQADGSGTYYAEGATYTDDADLTLYAQWNRPPVVDAGPDQIVYLSEGGGEPWTPEGLTLAAWYDASASDSITLASGRVSQWNDLSGNERHATQGASNRQPGYHAADTRLNNLPTIGYDGISTDLWRYLDTPALTFTNVYVVTYYDAETFDNWRVLMSDNQATVNRIRGTQNNITFGLAGFRMYRDGASANTNTALPMGPTLWRGEATRDFGNVPWSILGQKDGWWTTWGRGAIGEMIFTDGTEDLATQQMIEGYLAHKWGLEDNLPSDHPYKAAAPGGSSATATLAGYASDPDGDALTTVWTREEGPAAASFANASVTNTTVTFTEAGTYTLRLTADDGFAQAFDEVVITVSAPGVEIYTVTYDGNDNTGGTAPVDPESPYASDAEVTVLGPGDLEKTGHTFSGWNTAADGSGTSYSAGNTFTITANTTLYARWSLNEYTVTFQPGVHGALDGGDPDVVQIVAHGAATPTAPTVIPDAGYEFTGWDPELPATITDDFTTTAQYALKTYTVSFVTDGTPGATLSGNTNQVVSHGGSTTAVTANAPADHQFVSWTRGEVVYSPAAEVVVTDVTADQTLVANFVPNDAIAITAGSAEKVYDGLPLTADDYSYTGELAEGHTLVSVTVTGSQTLAGIGENVPSGAIIRDAADQDVTDTYTITYFSGALTVTPRPITITAESAEKVYDGTALTANGYAITEGTLAADDSLDAVTVTGSQTDAGEGVNVPSAAVITNASAENVTASYDITYANGTLTVTKADSTITVTGDSIYAYTGAGVGPDSANVDGSTGTVTFSYEGTGGTSYGPSANSPIAVGTYAAVATVAEDINHFGAQSEAFAFEVIRGTPIVAQWPEASDITLGQAISASTLSGGEASVDGTFAFTHPEIVPSTGGDYPASVTFTPAEPGNYTDVVGNVYVFVDASGTLPFEEDFEVLTPGELNNQNNWQSSGVEVQGDVVRMGSQAAQINDANGYLKQAFIDERTNVWTDVYYQPAFFDGEPGTPDTDATTILVFNAGGHPVVYDGETLRTFSDVSIVAGEWVRVTVRSDYVSKTWDLYVDTELVAAGLGFYDATAAHYREFSVSGAGTESVAIDEILIDVVSTMVPQIDLWPHAEAMVVSNTLATARLSGGSASVAGTFGFAVPDMFMDTVDIYEVDVVFTPAHARYVSVSGVVEIVVGVQGTIPFAREGMLNEQFSGTVGSRYSESPTGGIGGSIGINLANDVAVAFDGSLSDWREEGDFIKDARFTVGTYFRMSRLGSRTGLGGQILKLGLTNGDAQGFAGLPFSTLQLESIDDETGGGTAVFVVRESVATNSVPFEIRTNQWYYFETTFTRGEDAEVHYFMGIATVKDNGAFDERLRSYNAYSGDDQLVAETLNKKLYGAFQGGRAFGLETQFEEQIVETKSGGGMMIMGESEEDAEGVLDEFYVSSAGEGNWEIIPTLAVISGVRSRIEDGVAVISWDVSLELGTVGYYLERWTDGVWQRVNDELILSDPFMPSPYSYEQADPGAPLGTTQLYRIVELDDQGRLLYYGPYELELDGGEISYWTWAAGIDWGDADSSPDADPDGDGLTNWQEYLAGTDPLSANSVLQISHIERVPDGILLRWPSAEGRTYAIELAPEPGQPFVAVATDIVATAPENSVVLPISGDAAACGYFRVILK